MKALTLLLFVAVLTGCGKQHDPQEVKPLVSVKVARIERADVPIFVTAPATIYPKEQASIASRLTAPIRKLSAHKGDSVDAGQVLIQLENRDVAAQRDQAKAALDDAEASLKKTVSGTLPADVERARREVDTGRAALDQAQKNDDRRRSLFAQGAIPQRDLLTADTELSIAKSNFETAQRSLDLLVNQSRGSDIEIARARVAQAAARLAEANTNLQFAEITAPFRGTITDQLLYPGDMAKPDSPIFTMMDLSTVTARAQVPDARVAEIERGQICKFGSGDEKSAALEGRVTVVSRSVDSARRTVEVWCEIDRPPVSLRAGLFGSLNIQTSTLVNALTVPIEAVQRQEGTQSGTVLVVDESHTAHQKVVVVGATHAGRIVVEKGLEANDPIVTEGGYGTADGTAVRVVSEAAAGSKR